jgi:hypothetical protein
LKALKQLHYPNNRQAMAAVIACAVLLAVLVVMWLAVATNTALLNQQLDQNDANQRQLTEEANQLWRHIGDVTSPAQMKTRMQQAGFGTPASTLYLFVPTATAVISPTIPSDGGAK